MELLLDSSNERRFMRLGLERVAFYHDLLGFPLNNFKSIHVAGSNGKGSVSLKVYKALKLSGRSVGLFSSPHLFSALERIIVNDSTISIANFNRLSNYINYLSCLHRESISYFEKIFLIMSLYFAESGVEFAVLETGLGGRLDATNIVSPIITAITSISLEHTDILGHDIKSIAMEKSGIIKENIPVVIGDMCDDAYIEICNIANLKHSKIIKTVKCENYEEHNQAIAKDLIENLLEPFNASVVREGLRYVPMFRTQLICKQPNIILDVCHNIEGMTSSLHLLSRFRKKLIVICAMANDKNMPACIELLSKNHSVKLIYTASLNGCKESYDIHNINGLNVILESNIIKAIKLALASMDRRHDSILILGSFSFMADVVTFLSKEGLELNFDLRFDNKKYANFWDLENSKGL